MLQFKSKRNSVYLQDNFVVKEHLNGQNAREECTILNSLYSKGVHVPKVITISESTITMEYIKGKTLPSFLESVCNVGYEDLLESVSHKLALWFVSFYNAVEHSTTVENRGDVNGRNFIITTDSVFGVDFEKRSFGSKEQDIGRLMAFVLTYKGIDESVKRFLAVRLLQDCSSILKLDCKLLESEIKKEISAMDKRRTAQLQQ